MKTKVYSLLLLSLILFFCSCKKEIFLSENVTKEQKSITNYHSIDVSDAFNVFINLSETEEKIEVEANENLHRYIIIENNSNTLFIKLDNHITIHHNPVLNVYITTKEITDFRASGASQIIIRDTLRTNDANIDLSGASLCNGFLEVKNLSIKLSGASKLELKGTGESTEVIISGASEIKAFHFSTGYLDANLSGASIASFYVTGEIDVDASGASTLLYKGPGWVDSQKISGASVVKKMD
jgi:hypothetical protein